MWKAELDIVEMPNAVITGNAGKLTIIARGKTYTHNFSERSSVEIPGTWTPAHIIWETDYPVSFIKIEGAIERKALKALLVPLAVVCSLLGVALLKRWKK